MERIKEMPFVGSFLNLLNTYPRISAWIVLAAGIVGLLIYEARDVGLTTGNWIALILASIIVAGLCIWIVSWEDEDEAAPEPMRVKSETKPVEAEVVAEEPKTEEAPSDDTPADAAT